MSFTVEEKSRHVHVIRCDMQSRTSEQWFLLSSDRHHDNAFCDWKMELEHLREAKERKAGLLDIGDLHCAMQGKWDKRADRSHLRPVYQTGPYLDVLVNEASKFYSPFASLWAFMSPGNHETSIDKKHETDLTQRTFERLKAAGADKLCLGSYTGWIRIVAQRGDRSRQVIVNYHHGYGGGGAVTKDVIQTSRKAVYLANADIVWSGHTHDSWQLPIQRLKLNDADREEEIRQVHVKTAGYKRSHRQHAGWETERGMCPKPVGAYWLRLFWKRDILEFELTEAK